MKIDHGTKSKQSKVKQTKKYCSRVLFKLTEILFEILALSLMDIFFIIIQIRLLQNQMEEKPLSPFVSKLILKQISNVVEIKPNQKFKPVAKRSSSSSQLPTIKKNGSVILQTKWIKQDLVKQRQLLQKNSYSLKQKRSSYRMSQHKSQRHQSHSKADFKTISDIQQLEIMKKKNQLNSLLLKKRKSMQRMRLNIIIRQALNDLMQKRQKLLNPLQQNQFSHSINF